MSWMRAILPGGAEEKPSWRCCTIWAADKPTITVFNKADLIKDQYELRSLVAETPNSVYLSARTAEGIPQLIERVVTTMEGLLVSVTSTFRTTAATWWRSV